MYFKIELIDYGKTKIDASLKTHVGQLETETAALADTAISRFE